MQKIIFLVLATFPILNMAAQETDTIGNLPADTFNDYLISYLENNDVGFLWEGSISQDERLGYIGENYQRMEIHFNSIIQNFDNPFEYFVYGKSKVKNNICEFQGTMTIQETGYIPDDDNPEVKSGYIAGDFVFFEDRFCSHSGLFAGDFITFIYIGADSTLYYDDFNTDDPAYSNNLFTSLWYHYDSELIQQCNWGDKRIPGSADLDVGKESFKPSYRFLENGWKEYLDSIENKTPVETDNWWE